jgi:Major capsid protein Gp23
MNGFNEQLVAKWKPVLEHEDLPKIAESHKRFVIAQLLENTEAAMRMESGAAQQSGFLTETPVNAVGTGGYGSSGGTHVAGYDPILISLIRRAMPNLIAYDICGVQPMTGPTGLIFAMRSQYANSSSREALGSGVSEAFYDEANTQYSTDQFNGAGANTIGGAHTGTSGAFAGTSGAATYNFKGGMATSTLEGLGSSADTFPEMAFSIDKVSVTAKSRALKAEYTIELAQDLKAVHGLDAETELANILQSEILAEINREVVRTINLSARNGAQTGTTTAGTFDLDTDSNGRWSVEKFKGLMFHMEREANQIAKDTRRGKANIVICSSDVASALQMAGVLDYTPALASNNLQVDDTGNTFAGVLNGRFRVYIDPYTTGNYMTVGYKGANAFDAGLFYCPYVPLQMVRAVGQDTFQPKIGFKTRYGMVANPFARSVQGTPNLSDGTIVSNTNSYYRRVIVSNIM